MVYVGLKSSALAGLSLCTLNCLVLAELLYLSLVCCGEAYCGFFLGGLRVDKESGSITLTRSRVSLPMSLVLDSGCFEADFRVWLMSFISFCFLGSSVRYLMSPRMIANLSLKLSSVFASSS